MKSPEIHKALSELMAEYENDRNILRPIESRRKWLGRAVPLLSFSPTLHGNALETADVFSQPGFSSSMYDRLEARILLLVQQGITESEHDFNPPEPEVKKEEIKNSYESLWDIARVLTLPQWVVVIGILIAVLAIGFRAAQVEFFQEAWELVKKLKG